MSLTWVTIWAIINHLLGILAPAYVFIPIPLLTDILASASLAITAFTGATVVLWGKAYDLQGETQTAYAVAYVSSFILGLFILFVAHVFARNSDQRVEESRTGDGQGNRACWHVVPAVFAYTAYAGFPAVALWFGGGNVDELDPETLPNEIASNAVWLASIAAAQVAALIISGLLIVPGIMLLIAHKGDMVVCCALVTGVSFPVAGYLASVYFSVRMLTGISDLTTNGEGTGAEGEIVAHISSVIGAPTILFYSVLYKGLVQ